MNPDIAGNQTASVVAANIFSRLVTLDVDGRLLPDLAARWSVDANQTGYTFELRRGVRWHDGAPFSGEDVKWTLEQLRTSASLSRQAVERIRQIDVLDAHTVRIQLAEPWAPFLTSLAQADVAILPKHRFARGDRRSHPENDHPVGTRPFKFAEWRRGQWLALPPTLTTSSPARMSNGWSTCWRPTAGRRSTWRSRGR